MSEHLTPQDLRVTAFELRSDLIQLETERALALNSGLEAAGPPRIAALEEALDQRRQLYVAAAVTEVLRTDLRAEQPWSPRGSERHDPAGCLVNWS